jgi:hypothetical protein
MDGDPELVDLMLVALHEGVEGALELEAHGHGALHEAPRKKS